MNALLLAFSTLLAPTAAPPAPAPALVRQDEVPDGRPEIKELLKTLSSHAKKRGKEDVQAIEVIDQLVQEFPQCGPKDRKAIVKALDKNFKEKRQETDGVRDNKLYLASTRALGEMAPESVDVLLSWIGHKSHRKDIVLQTALIEELGQTRSPKAREPLIKMLDDEDPSIQAAVATALGEYEDAELKDRKENFEELLKLLMSVKGQKDSDLNDIIARQRWNVISAPIITSLQRLSGEGETDPDAWQRWWNKNKREDWDEGA